MALKLRLRGMNVYFVYATPLVDEYSGPEFCEPSLSPEAGLPCGGHSSGRSLRRSVAIFYGRLGTLCVAVIAE